MAAAPERQCLFADPEPFSPSIFLDLPPTPRADANGNGEVSASSDNLVLGFISRILMEEGINEQFFYQFPDHPVLLQAQEPYAKILADAATNSAASSGPPAAVSPSTSDDDLAQLGLSPPYPDDDGGGSPELEQSPAQLTLPGGDGDHAALAAALFNGGDADAEMVNKAFLKGMEEAKRFLPATNMDREAENGRGRKDRGRDRLSSDDLEAEACRKSKLMVPEPEETGEVVDQMILNGLEMCLKEMKALRITMSSEANKKKNTRKKGRPGRPSTNEAVELSTLLVQCAQAVATDNRRSATELVGQIKQRSSPSGDATQRLAHCFAEGLEARLAGSGSQLYTSLMAERISFTEYLKACYSYLGACCFEMTAFSFSNATILKTIAARGRKKVHIVDYGVNYGFQWPSLLHRLASLEGGPPELRITGIDLPQPGFRPAERIEEAGRRLTSYARQLGVPFKFHGITARWDTVGVDDLNLDPDEALIVNSLQFENLMDEGVDIDSPSPRDVVLKTIRKMQPDAFILFVTNASYSSPFFETRFREVLFFFSAMFDMLDATAPRDSQQRLLVERVFFRQCGLNVVACEGTDRVERPETYKQWQLRNNRAGLRQLPLDDDTVKTLRDQVRDEYHKDFVIDTDHNWLLQGWKGRILYAMSTWVADDAVSEL